MAIASCQASTGTGPCLWSIPFRWKGPEVLPRAQPRSALLYLPAADPSAALWGQVEEVCFTPLWMPETQRQPHIPNTHQPNTEQALLSSPEDGKE
jgi:hypothetical protein